MQTPPQTFVLSKVHNSSFYTACSKICSENLEGMLLILTLLENDQF